MDKELLIKGYVGGKTVSALAKEFKISRQAILGHLKRAGVYEKGEVTPQVTPPDDMLHVTSKSKSVKKGVKSKVPEGYYDNGAGSVCKMNADGSKYFLEGLDMWLPVVNDEGELAQHVDYLPQGKRFRPTHPDHPRNKWKKDAGLKHPYETYDDWQRRVG